MQREDGASMIRQQMPQQKPGRRQHGRIIAQFGRSGRTTTGFMNALIDVADGKIMPFLVAF